VRDQVLHKVFQIHTQANTDMKLIQQYTYMENTFRVSTRFCHIILDGTGKTSFVPIPGAQAHIYLLSGDCDWFGGRVIVKLGMNNSASNASIKRAASGPVGSPSTVISSSILFLKESFSAAIPSNNSKH
jgi:hypothetical protein